MEEKKKEEEEGEGEGEGEAGEELQSRCAHGQVRGGGAYGSELRLSLKRALNFSCSLFSLYQTACG